MYNLNMLLDFTALSNGSNSSVTDDYFQCDNGECIEIRERCNSVLMIAMKKTAVSSLNVYLYIEISIM